MCSIKNEKINVFILCSSYYTEDGKDMTIGGIQTYITMLAKLIKKKDLNPIILQFSDTKFAKLYQ